MPKLKALSVVLLLISSFTATAETRLLAHDVSLRPITGELASVETPRPDNCPKGAVCETVTVANLVFRLNGCLNRLGDVRYQTEYVDGKFKVYVSATEIVSKKSESVKCIVAPTAMARVTLTMGFVNPENVEVQFLQGQAAL